MKLSAIKLVTIIAPVYLKQEIVKFLRAAGISGYTDYYAHGRGEMQLHDIDVEETENVQFKILVPSMVAHALMHVIAEEFFEKEKVIVFEQDANVIRQEKFNKVDYENT
ncbi:MAG: hypothetical protein KC713_00365 [Candidatus Omnitrophica bacterium]|nr:hypothetical protein [Candidatus Omnitrophota bacterium]